MARAATETGREGNAGPGVHVGRALWLGLALALLPGCVTLKTFLSRGDGRVIQTPTGSCVELMPESRLHPVGACQQADLYQIMAVERQVTLPGKTFRQLVRERLWQFVRATDYPWRTLRDASVEMWLVAPVFAPEAAHLVAAVISTGGNFAVRLELEPSRWRVGADDVLWLGSERYPSLAAKQAGVVEILARRHVSLGSLTRYVERAELRRLATAGGYETVQEVAVSAGAVTVRTRAFSERQVALRLASLNDTRSLVSDVRLRPAKELEGARAVVFRFPFAGKD